MGLLEKLKSTLGLQSPEEGAEGTTVNVEYEPDPESEAAVKGTDEPVAAGTSAAGSTGSITEEPPEVPGDDDVAAAAEPAEAAGPESQVETPETTDVEAEAEAEAEADDAEAEPEAEPEVGTDESVDAIQGIGPAYAERLREAGIETVGDLRGADVTDLAEETGLSEKRLGRWVERAGG